MAYSPNVSRKSTNYQIIMVCILHHKMKKDLFVSLFLLNCATFLTIVAQVKVFGLLVKGLRVAIDLIVQLEEERHIMSSLSKVLKLPTLSGSSGVDKLLTQFEAAIDSDFPNYEVCFSFYWRMFFFRMLSFCLNMLFIIMSCRA